MGQDQTVVENPTPTPLATATSIPSTASSTAKTYPLTEVAKHNKSTDCWLAISGKVYDVTKFIASGMHPGGEAILQGCGKDATTLFETRPMGSGTPHSAQAHAALVNFYIGDLK
ncbi:cytochrome b5 domain-containing protein [Candidatus Parcubacteria bacterium]|nr:cytochrome b5 domain-containing protein [Candidatus Parcubacteria bacterium]